MPIHPHGGKYWTIGHGKAKYKSLASVKRAYRGYLAAKHMRAKGIPPKRK